jgi:hypothetical protein
MQGHSRIGQKRVMILKELKRRHISGFRKYLRVAQGTRERRHFHCDFGVKFSGNRSLHDTHLTYADNDIAKIELNLTNDLESNREWLIVNKLTLNMSKTEFMVIGSRQRLYTFDNAPVLTIGGAPIKQVKSTKSLGLHIDEHLSWSVHVDAI